MSKELIIGLGGCGGKCIREFRKTCKLREKDFENLTSLGAKFEYLYIDSDDDILKEKGWSIFGQSLELTPNEKILLKKQGPMPPITQIMGLTNISPWLGDIIQNFRKKKKDTNAADDKISAELQGMDGAGQLRRYGRALFALHSNKIRIALDRKIQSLTSGSSDKSFNCRIFCTLGGGTGSGSVVDMVTLVHSISSRLSFTCNLSLYVFVAGGQASINNVGSFFENEYCALRDLNALAIGSYRPYMAGVDASAEQDNNFDPNQINKPIHRIYFSTELNPANTPYADQVKYMAASCFDTIVYTTTPGNNGANCLRAFTGQDLEVNHPYETNEGNPARSYRFSAMGGRTWSVPTSKIRDLLKQDVENMVWTALLKGSALPKGVVSRNVQQLKGYSFNYSETDLSKLVDSFENKKFEGIKQICEQALAQKSQSADLLDEITQLAKGAISYFSNLKHDADKQAQLTSNYEILVNKVYDELYTALDKSMKWGSVFDVWGLNDVETYLTRYIDNLKTWVGTEVPGDEKSDNEELKSIEERMASRSAEWKKMGVLTFKCTKKAEQMLTAHQADARNMLKQAMNGFRRYVVDEFVDQLTLKLHSLQKMVKVIIEKVTEKGKEVSTRVDTYTNDLTKGKSGNGFYEYDEENLEKVRDAIQKGTKEFEKSMVDYFNQWVECIGSVSSYADSKFDKFCDAIASGPDHDSGMLYQTAEALHNKVAITPLKSVLVGDIFARLEQIAGTSPTSWDNKLSKKVEAFTHDLPCSATIQGNDGLFIPNGQKSPVAALLIGFPASAAASRGKMAAWLENKIKESLPNNLAVWDARIDVYYHQTDEEIRILYQPYWFPARFSKVVDFVNAEYDRSSRDTQEMYKLYFSDIDDIKDKPSLTLQGERNKDHELKCELLSKLFIKITKNEGGVKTPVLVDMNEKVMIIKEVDKRGNAKYNDPVSSLNKQIPDRAFVDQCNFALRMSLGKLPEDANYTPMTQSEINAILDEYDAAVNAETTGTPAWSEANKKRDLVEKLLA